MKLLELVLFMAPMAGRDKEVPDRVILRVFEEHSDLILSTREVAERLPISRRGTHPRLLELEDRGLLDSKKVGRSKAYWLTDAGREYLEDCGGDNAEADT